MSAAVIGVLVILWAVVLVPMWLRRHDKANELAAVDRFAGAMRVLSRRSGDRDRREPGAGRYVVMPARSAAAREMDVFVPDKRPARFAAPSEPAAYSQADRLDRRAVDDRQGGQVYRAPSLGAVASGRARRVAARRRLATLLLTLFVVTLLAAGLLGGALIAVQACVDVLVVAGVLHLRAGVLAERSLARRAAGRASAVRVRAQAQSRWAAEGDAYQGADLQVGGEPETAALPLAAPRMARRAPQAAPARSVVAEPRSWGRRAAALRPAVAAAARRLSATSAQAARSAPTEQVFAEERFPQVRAGGEAPGRTAAPGHAAAPGRAAPRRTARGGARPPATAGSPAAPRTAAASFSADAAAEPITGARIAPAARARTVDLTQPGKWSESQAAVRGAPAAGGAPSRPPSTGVLSNGALSSGPAATGSGAPKLPAPEAALLDQQGFDDPITRQLLDEQRAEAAALTGTDRPNADFTAEDDELDRILRRAVGE